MSNDHIEDAIQNEDLNSNELNELDGTPNGVILERIKRQTGLPHRYPDALSHFFMTHHIRGSHSAI
ncbi:MAG: hypothetical protein ACI9CF_000819 [Candidatus Omnitrophota bacterium]|jgi:hypothetical protein